jgi:uncharacterized membrane protein YfcA
LIQFNYLKPRHNFIDITFGIEHPKRIHRDFMHLGFEIFIMLFFVGLLAGFIDSIAGGGGLITLPALLSVGMPPHLALGTNKLQGTFGVCTAAVNFVRKGKVDLKECSLGILATLMGASIGALTIQWLDSQFLSHLVPFLLLFVFIYTVFSRNLGLEETKAKINAPLYYLLFGLVLGFYDGFFGPGTGAFWTASLLILLGYHLTKAVGVTKIMNFTSNLVALVVFSVAGHVHIYVGVTMAAGQVIGARLGSNMAIKKGAGFIRPVFLSIVFLTIIRLFYINYF